MKEFLKELKTFMLSHKKLWLVPMLIFLTLLISLSYFLHTTSQVPFIYTVF